MEDVTKCIVENCLGCKSYNKCLSSALDVNLKLNRHYVECEHFNNIKLEAGNAIVALKKIVTEANLNLSKKDIKTFLYNVNKE